MREFKIWADVLNYGKKILKNAGIAEADLDSWYLFEESFGISRGRSIFFAQGRTLSGLAQKMTAQEQHGNSLESGNALECRTVAERENVSGYENTH